MNSLNLLLLFTIVLCNGEDEEEGIITTSSPAPSFSSSCSCVLKDIQLLDLRESFTNCRPDSSAASLNSSSLLLCLPLRTRLRSIALSGSIPQASVQVLEHLDCGCEPPVQASPRHKRSSSSSSRGSPDKNNSLPPSKVSFPPKYGNLTTYETCLACKMQMDFCQEDGKVFDSDVCHCVFPASRTFLNSFYTLGVVMLTIMVCCFLVFGVQKGDENVLSSSRRVSSSSNHRRRLSSYRLESGGMPPERSDRIVRPSLTGPSQVNAIHSSPIGGGGVRKDLLGKSETCSG